MYRSHSHRDEREKGAMKMKKTNAGGGRVRARLHFIYRILSTAPYNRKWGKVAVCISLYIFTHKLNQETGGG